MISNLKQYKITVRKLRELEAQLKSVKTDRTANPLRDQLLLASLQHSRDELKNEVHAYERIKNSRGGILKERLISELPSIITEYKIMYGLTQKQLSDLLGLKEQQLQRYEATGFRHVTFRNLLRFIERIGLEIRIKETRLSD